MSTDYKAENAQPFVPEPQFQSNSKAAIHLGGLINDIHEANLKAQGVGGALLVMQAKEYKRFFEAIHHNNSWRDYLKNQAIATLKEVINPNSKGYSNIDNATLKAYDQFLSTLMVVVDKDSEKVEYKISIPPERTLVNPGMEDT